MNRCLYCGEYMRWGCQKGWYCPNGCVIKTSISNHTELVEHPQSTTTTSIEKIVETTAHLKELKAKED